MTKTNSFNIGRGANARAYHILTGQMPCPTSYTVVSGYCKKGHGVQNKHLTYTSNHACTECERHRVSTSEYSQLKQNKQAPRNKAALHAYEDKLDAQDDLDPLL